MKTSLQFFKDMGVCDGAYAVLEQYFRTNGVTKLDYAQGYEVMLSMMDQLEIEAAQSGEPSHDTAQGWLQWTYDLRNRPEAIMYFGDHIEKYEYKTMDGYTHSSLDEAEEHEMLLGNETKTGYRDINSVCGIKVTDQGETWQVLRDLSNIDWSDYDKFVWTDIKSGQKFETPSATEALVHYNFMGTIFEEIDQMVTMRNSLIKRKIADNTDTYEVWV